MFRIYSRNTIQYMVIGIILLLVVSGCNNNTTKVVAVTGISLNHESINLSINQVEALIASIQPDNATNKDVVWGSSHEDIATVSASGIVSAFASGTTVITVTTVEGGFVASCIVNVVVPVTGITLNKSSTSIAFGGTELLTAIIIPSNATN